MSSPNKHANFRLLYRGAFSLPDSHLLLDGITFAARVSEKDNKLLDNPLALALESMRGRPSLHFLGTVSLKDINMDTEGDITMDIHPQAILSRLYFENMFCVDTALHNRTGIRVALGDSDGSETTQMVIFASVPDAGTPVQLTVARITLEPTPKRPTRLPRPDDPTPRQPPPVLTSKARDGHSNMGSKRQKLEDGTAALLGSGVRLGQQSAAAEFAVPAPPPLPVRAKKKQEEDVFGSAEAVKKKDSLDGKGAKRQRDEEEETLERDNKMVIKRTTVQQLKLTPIGKAHPEYNEIYRWIYRGVEFALRAHMKTQPLDPQDVCRLVKIHTDMYTAQALV